ncbi:MAG: hypothetical protein NT080_09750 [Spirochaetes bacterium]|nr:hypothetical protein [Spirochaetota bacterium]
MSGHCKAALAAILVAVFAAAPGGITWAQAKAEDPVGIVLSSRDGVLVKRPGESETQARPGMKLYRDSSLVLKADMKVGIIQVFTAGEGLTAFTRFPVTFTSASIKPIPKDQADRIMAGIGGSALTSTRGKGTEKLLDWFIRIATEEYGVPKSYGNLGGIAQADIDAGLSIVFGSAASSRDSFELNPLRYRFSEGVSVKSVSVELLDAGLEPVVPARALPAKNGEWVFAFREFTYEAGAPYVVRFSFTLADGTKAAWGTGFVARTADDIAMVESEAKEGIGPSATPFERALVRAGVYAKYELQLGYLSVLKAAGISLDGWL